MILLQVNALTKYYGAETALSNIKLEIQKRDRIALVGRNGAGKSTLLKIIAGLMSYDGGEIIKPKDVSIGYLAQDTGLESSLSIWDEMLTVFAPLRSLEQELRNLEQRMADPAVYNDDAIYQRTLKEYDLSQVKFKEMGGYQYEADIRSILHGLQFSGFDPGTTISTLSGGQKTRLALGKLLLTKPDILILDEPTNHLDLETLSWLEQYLQGYPGSVLIVSHDRYFLDKVVSLVYELSRTAIKRYNGNYTDYLTAKAENYEREMKQYEKQQDEIAKLKDFVQKNIARASTTKRAQSRRKQLEKIQEMDRPQGDEKSASFSFGIERQSGNDVIGIHNLAIGYDDRTIADNISIRVSRGDSIALVGPNGIGKSTLLKTLIGAMPALRGSFQIGTNVKIGYYDQNQANLMSNKRVLNELWDDYPGRNEKDIRTILGNFLFSGDDVLKPVSTLSGGEKARLALARLMMEKANLLILDEPTNHLDLDSKIVLENALVDYPGTILFVSHDRYFINRIASKVVELSPHNAVEYLGDYDYYAAKKQEQAELAEFDAANEPKNKPEKPAGRIDKEVQKRERQKKRRLEELESMIEELEPLISEYNEQLCDPEIFQDHEKVLEINASLEKAKEDLDTLLEEWAEIEESLQES
ncbi:ABC-F family ATP-binding cassette domain-containing protein [Peribacillus sp. SCS-37]|uniref:ABC-F family ATP-binding cassette domain-containing protein n=1 Tax=Paraperibacillus esterisolvens TaxID=3115296 RepID=UPI003906443A